MGNSQNDFQDSYHDDPIEEISHSKLRSTFLTTGVLILGSIFFFQSTLASNISLSSGRGVEFGQGVSQTVACSGQNSLTLTPGSTFINGSNAAGSHYLKTITVSDIPTGCRGADFTIRAYGDSDNTPLSLFNTNSKIVTIETIDTPGTVNDGGIAWAGAAGMSVSASTTGDAFTVTFTVPVASSSSVAKITLESSKPYYYGGPGGGGGTVFYVSTTGFNCGPTFTARCKYLEAAPSGWNGGSEPTQAWAIPYYQAEDVASIADDFSSVNNGSTAIGLGYQNSLAIVDQNGPYNEVSRSFAAGTARAYSGGSMKDWYLPDSAELNQMCKWVKKVAWTSDATVCVGGTINSGTGAAGFISHIYWSSSEYNVYNGRYQWFNDGVQGSTGKGFAYYVRPVRAF